MTLGERLDQYRGIGPGFDFLRIGLALSIVLTHAFFLTENGWLRDTPAWFIEYALVPMFFALSGFLIAGSAKRLSLGNFLLNRGLRIAPALAVDIVVCALIIGPIFTTLSLADYFSHVDFWKYFSNIFGIIHYRLPGVFDSNPSWRVNGALWTVPCEIVCYAIISGMIVLRVVDQPRVIGAMIVALLAAGLVCQTAAFQQEAPWIARKVANTFVVKRPGQLYAAFLCGIWVYAMRYRIPYSSRLLLVCLAACVIASLLFGSAEIDRVTTRVVLVPVLVYITVFIGVTPVWIPSYFHRGDYSYGVYLYHDPLLQSVIATAPIMALPQTLRPFATFLLAIPFVIALATFSWHRIEKPILSLRKRFSFVAKVRGVDTPNDAIAAPDVFKSDERRPQPAE